LYLLPEPLALREASAADQGFLEALYFSSREDLHQAVADAAMLKQLIALQQRTQEVGFRHGFPNAAHLILQQGGQSIGRVVVDTGPSDMRLVDIAIAPPARRNGAATAVLRALQAAAQSQGLPVSLAVSKSNHAARKLYLGLGFAVRTEDALFEQMTWLGHQA